MVRRTTDRVLQLRVVALGPAVAITCLLASPPAFGQETLSLSQWRADLAQLVAAVRNHHADLFHTVSEDEFERAVSRVSADLPTLTGAQIVTELKRLVAMIGDGHTALRGGVDLLSGFYPLRVKAFDDGLFIYAAATSLVQAVGTRLVAIDDTPIEEALEAVSRITHGDNAQSRRHFAMELLTVPELLWGLAITPDGRPARFALETREGRGLALTPTAVSFDTRLEWVDARDVARSPTPLSLSHPERPFWFEYLPASHTVYVHLSAIRDRADQSLADFFGEVLEIADAHSPVRLVLDLRRNGGGNKRLNQPIIQGLTARPHLTERSRFFVLIGRETFSAAVHLATNLEQRTDATFVGEPTGGRPNHFGDSRAVRLAHSGLVVTPATIYWEDSAPDDERPWIAPDIPVPVTFDDYRAGRDPVLDTVLTR